MKSFRVLSLVLVLFVLTMGTAFAGDFKVEGIEQTYDSLTVSGRGFIEGSELESFGLISKVNGNDMILSGTGIKMVFVKGKNTVTVNGTPFTLDSNAFMNAGKAYYPLRFVFETMDYSVGYDSASKMTSISRNTASFFPVVIADGTTLYSFKAPVSTIVSLAPSITEILFAIGAEETLIGRTKFCDYPAQVSKIQSVGTLYEPDLEGILALEPEVVIAATHMNEDVMKQLKTAGIQTVTQKSPEKVSDIYELIKKIGMITDHGHEARALVSTLKAKQNRVENIVKSIPEADRKAVYYVVGTGKKEFSAGSKTFIHEVITKAGVINVAADVESWSYSLEKLIDHDPEYLIGDSFNIGAMKEGTNYASLTAIRNGKTIVVDGNVFSRPGPRIVEIGMKTIIEKIYPEYAYLLNY